ncbi:hypothetical protein NBT05_00090 [Aquimarina sp. ERC-38]|uniref:hypothetical protein n=1 Tax=Aquimarina sp. ERC-38 TaxID=2949996 RepID=UPI0022462D9F|nr:hypothetical protein [Aquimarina sp. ERC-38]UZO80902.1 hypothetical protein NBT05_00090 [Aquimarina sp. ERC-38]
MKSQSESKKIEDHQSNATENGPGRMAGYGGRDAEKLEQDLRATSKGKEVENEE